MIERYPRDAGSRTVILRSAKRTNDKVLFFFSHLQHPRMWRRVKGLIESGMDCTVIGFTRPTQQYPTNNEGISLGCVRDVNYIDRVWIYLKCAWSCRRYMKKNDICYAFSLDVLILLYLLSLTLRGSAVLCYELADIRPIMSRSGVISAVLRCIERYLINRCRCVVLTSEAYYSGYFREVQKFQNFPYLVIEHKPDVDPAVRSSIQKREFNGVITIGYFGIIKSEISLRFLRHLVDFGKGRLKVVLRGVFNYPVVDHAALEMIRGAQHMVYNGPYKSPEDLLSIYQDVDLIWDAYCEGDNSRWQRTTRFSEACFFKRPLIVNEETQDGRLAKLYGIGIGIDFGSFDASCDKISRIGQAELEQWRQKLEQLPSHLIFYQDEYMRLNRLLRTPELN